MQERKAFLSAKDKCLRHLRKLKCSWMGGAFSLLLVVRTGMPFTGSYATVFEMVKRQVRASKLSKEEKLMSWRGLKTKGTYEEGKVPVWRWLSMEAAG